MTLESSSKGVLIKSEKYNYAYGVYIKEGNRNDISKLKENISIVLNGNNFYQSKVLVVGDSNARHYATFFFKNFSSFYSLILNGTLPYSKSL